MQASPTDIKVMELERQLKALLEAVKVDAAGNVEIKSRGGAKIELSGPTVNINSGALEVT